MAVTVLAPAKINLTLDITGKREDGYHFVDMVMQSVSLYDKVSVAQKQEKGIMLSCNVAGIPCDSRNTVYKAVSLFQKKIGVLCGFSITIEKQIPSEAGLAGGSSDAAAVLLALNHLYGNPFTMAALAEMGAQIGADVPFCLYGGTMLSTGIGTKLQPLCAVPACFFVLVKPDIGVSTTEAYALCDSRGYTQEVHSSALIEALQSQDVSALANCFFNAFEQVLCIEAVDSIKRLLLANGALGACMSGSGPTVFGVFKEEETACRCAQRLKKKYSTVCIAQPVKHGCFIEKTA